MTGTQATAPPLARRTVVAAGCCLGLTALTACGGSEEAAPPANGTTGGTGGTGGTDTGGGGAGGDVLVRTAEIPEGGGKVVGDVVVTQPQAGVFKAFSSKCTHQGCAVKDVADGVIVCPCHNSRFDATDGSVKGGPATMPLPEQAIAVEGDAIRLA
ncbi:Rieske (2Fe-2S) protein [Streptomyces sp. NPDC005805]|uniref:Rieske (2Fe-2S) protein n=1 Tax=Streptomyces sp. NPDC005805 TaxID=3157068 RepID=UPI003405680C